MKAIKCYVMFFWSVRSFTGRKVLDHHSQCWGLRSRTKHSPECHPFSFEWKRSGSERSRPDLDWDGSSRQSKTVLVVSRELYLSRHCCEQSREGVFWSRSWRWVWCSSTRRRCRVRCSPDAIQTHQRAWLSSWCRGKLMLGSQCCAPSPCAHLSKSWASRGVAPWAKFSRPA